MADAFSDSVRGTILRERMVPPGARVLVALSGGPDSVALLAALVELRQALAASVTAAHLNHRLRGAAADADERLAVEVASHLGVGLRLERLPAGALEHSAGGLEQAARRARYGFLHAAAAAEGCGRIATGHTRDDQAETVLLRLLRGSGPTGLSGIRAVRGDGVVRPLIDVGRQEVLAYLERRRLPFARDASNQDPRFTRNRIRLELLPLMRRFNPRVAEQLAALGRDLGARAETETELAAELARRCSDPEGGLALSGLGELPPAARRAVLRAWLQQRRGGLRRLGRRHLQAAAACAHSGRRLALPGGEVLGNEHGILRLSLLAEEMPDDAIELNQGQEVSFRGRWRLRAAEICGRGDHRLPAALSEAAFDADQLELPLRVRRWRAGDRIQPLGMAGHRKLADIFVDRKVPRSQRHWLPLVESAGEIVWVPGVVRSARATISPDTLRLLRLEAVRSTASGSQAPDSGSPAA